MWKELDSTQLKIDGLNYNNLKEERSKIKRKNMRHMSTNFCSTFHKKREKSTFIYIYIDMLFNHLKHGKYFEFFIIFKIRLKY